MGDKWDKFTSIVGFLIILFIFIILPIAGIIGIFLLYAFFELFMDALFPTRLFPLIAILILVVLIIIGVIVMLVEFRKTHYKVRASSTRAKQLEDHIITILTEHRGQRYTAEMLLEYIAFYDRNQKVFNKFLLRMVREDKLDYDYDGKNDLYYIS